MKTLKFLLLGIVSILGIGLSSAEITFISYPFTGGPTYNLVPGYNSLPAFDNLAGYDAFHIFSPVDGLSLIGYSGTNLFSFNVPYIFADDFTIFNSTTSNISLTPTRVKLTGRPGFGSSIFPYYQSGYVGIYDYEISGSISVGGYGNGEFYMGENSCIYFYSNNSNISYCDLENHDHCYKAYSQLLICGDGFYYSNSTSYSRSFDYVGVRFFNIYSGGDSGQDFQSPVDGGIFDFNTFLIEKSILCYMSSGSYGGSYGDCNGINYTGFVDEYQHATPIWSGSSVEDYKGDLLFYNAKDLLTNYCYNTDSIQYQFCSQLDLYSGAYLMYYYENGLLNYYVLGDGFGIDLGNLGSGQLGELTCQGVWCDNFSQGLPEYNLTITGGENNDVFSGEILDSSYFIDLFTNNLFFSCPFDYSGSSFSIGNKLINALGGRDILKPINCFIAGFKQGQESTFFGNVDNYFGSGTLLSGTSPNHKKLYLLFDILLCIGIIIIYSKIFNSFMHK